ncbi:MAG: phosphatidate cytidylyltransferase [Myxococcales bacterium]|nr:phosphatidate cytidylyltransferase [Myxococcales bacterium]MCB9520085.1 phosphatidate cytidylyltransferase [Myxococcales bacterium]MCB9531811.1 phosphatidate cytidylyltransferase [Myxococcales bacterium]
MSDRAPSDLAKRLVTAAVGVPALFAIAFLAPNWAVWALYWVAGTLGAWELARMTGGGAPGPGGWAAVAAVALTLAALYWAPTESLLATVAVATLATLVVVVWTSPIDEVAARAGSAFLTIGYATPLFGALVLTAGATGDARFSVAASQAGWVLYPMAVIWSGDTGAYFAGRAFGRHKLAPTLSPKKTWEGAIGGLLASTLGGLAFGEWLLPELGPVRAAIIAIPAAAIGQAGDLVESAIKRATGVKDSSALLYGHGGVLDRVDALVFAAPCFAIAKWALGL